MFTSINLRTEECTCRGTKLGDEEITRDIPNVGENALNALSGYIDGINYGVGHGITATITPVIDSSSAITGLNALNSFFGTRPIDVAGNLEAQIQNGFESSLLHVDKGDVATALKMFSTIFEYSSVFIWM